MKIYTRTGDAGETSLLGGARLPKNAPRIDVYGTVDELNSVLGLARSAGVESQLDASLSRVQGELFELGARLAATGEQRQRQSGVGEAHVLRLEQEIDRFEEQLEPLQSFILPGGCQAAAALHLARTVCRRAERKLVALLQAEADDSYSEVYLNRLSDWLFVAARLANKAAGVSDTRWLPPAAD